MGVMELCWDSDINNIAVGSSSGPQIHCTLTADRVCVQVTGMTVVP